jgi:hypothetical protein
MGVQLPSLDLDREPTHHNLPLQSGGLVSRLWQGRAGASGVALEISEIELLEAPTPARLRQVWNTRRAGNPRPVIVFAHTADGLILCGPDGAPPPVATLDRTVAERIFRRILDEPPTQARLRAIALLSRAQGSGDVPGFRNRSLVSTHYVTNVLPRQAGRDWTDAAAHGSEALGKVGEALVRALGYGLTAIGPQEFQVRDGDESVAVVHVYADGTSLDRVGAGQSAPPASHALKRARELGLDHALLVAGSLLRIYSLRGEETLDEGVASAAYVEFDTDLLPAEHAQLLGALAAPDALRRDGRLSRIRAESGRYAVELRERFTKRLYEEVVDLVVRGIYDAAKRAGISPLPDEDRLYRATLVLLFRLLFLLYAEDRNLLPMQQSIYRGRSITDMVRSAAATASDPHRRFDAHATSIWTDLRQLFAAVRDGNADWGVPPYDGGLFTDGGGLDSGLLAAIDLPNAVIGPALHLLGWDESDGEAGKVDFGDLGVRQIGTIYEGLLSYEVAFAASDLRIDRRAQGEPYVEAQPGDQPDVLAGTPHIRSPQGGRKATGSYYTPAFAVERLVDQAVRTELQEHLAGVGGAMDVPTGSLFDFRVCDPAMGSGHFLVAALDAITEDLSAHLAAHPSSAVTAELARARGRLNEVGRQYGAPDLGEQVADLDLLRRMVLKRCIYGVDLNPMAVELARLGLWLHSLVPGLPLSYLGHNLQHGNSLVGIGAHHPEIGLLAYPAEAKARDAASAISSITDLELGEIDASEQRQRELREATDGLHALYDLVTTAPLRDADGGIAQLHAEQIVAGEPPARYAPVIAEARALASDLDAFHWRLAYPEVFLRDRPGFDAMLGNPPWEEATVERLGFYARYLPGIKSERSQIARERQIREFEAKYETIRERYELELAEKEAFRTYLTATYVLTRSGDPDLYKAFAERFLSLVRNGGRLGVVLPRSAFAGDGTTPFRERLFGVASIVNLDVLLNTGGWVFPDAEPRYTLMLVAAGLGDVKNRDLSVSPVIARRKDFERVDDERVDWTLEELRTALPDLAVPLLPSHRLATIFKRLVTSHPRFDSGKGGWRAVPWAEFHGTKDRKSGLLKEPGQVTGEWWPVYGGKSFDLWQPELWKRGEGELQFVLEPDVGLTELQAKRQRSSVWKAFPAAVLRDPATLPMHRARILFRDVTNRTNSRTVIASLVPPHVFAHNAAPSLVWPAGNAVDVAYLLGVMCSVPFDWIARRRVELHLNYFVLNSLTVPRPSRDDPRWRRVVELAGGLACIDDRYAEFAAAAEVAFGSSDPAIRSAMIAELDAVVAHLYGLARDELDEFFADFPATEAGISPGRRAAILEWYDRWAS